MKRKTFFIIASCALMLAFTGCKKAEQAPEPQPAAEAPKAEVQMPRGGGMMPPPFGDPYVRDVTEICGNGTDDDNDGKADCSDSDCAGYIDCVKHDAPVVDDAKCIAIDLANPSSKDKDVEVKKTDNDIDININSDQKVCIKLSGKHDGSVTVLSAKNADVDVVFDNIVISSDAAAGSLKLKSANKEKGNRFVVRLDGENSLTGNGTKASNKVLSCTTNLEIVGQGSLTVTAKYKTGIEVDDVMSVHSGKITIDVVRDNTNTDLKEKGFGIKAGNGLFVAGGDIAINGRDNMTNYETRGIKIDGKESEYGAGKGYMVMTGGNVTVETDGKGISAGWSKTDDGKTETTDDDPFPDVTIAGGLVRIHTYAEPRESRRMGPPPGMNPDNLPDDMPEEIKAQLKAQFEAEKNAPKDETPTLSPEGLEAKGFLTIKGGEIHIISTDDSINAAGKVEISGGKIFARATENDALDSNGTIHISGGEAILMGANEPECGLDADMSKNVSYSGGFVIAMGGENNAPGTIEGNSSFVQIDLIEKMHGGPGGHGPGGPGMGGPGGPGKRQNTKSVFAGKTLAVTAVDNNDVLAAVKVPDDYCGGGNLLVLSDKIAKDGKYVVYTDAALTGKDGSDLSWFDDAMLTSSATAAGEEKKDLTGGVPTKGMFDNFGGPGMGGPGGHGPAMGRGHSDKPSDAHADR